MDNDNYVIFKGGRNGIIILLDKDVNFETLKEQLKIKVSHAQKFFDKSKAAITFKGRHLSDEQEKECIDIIISESNLNITYIYNEFLDTYKENTNNIDIDIIPTKYHFGAVRSGQLIRFAGNIVIIGDVNPGGEIVADGNIIITGALKGLVHAGFKGRTDVIVTASKLLPIQLRIANLIACLPQHKIKSKSSEYAIVKDNKICIKSIHSKDLKKVF